MTVLARRTRDCARRLEIRYALPVPISEPFITGFPSDLLRIDRYSELVRGGLDHFTIEVSSQLRLTGAIGGRELSARFLRSSGPVGPLVAAVDRKLELAGFGSVEHAAEAA